MRKVLALAAALSALGLAAAQACGAHSTVSNDNMTPIQTAQLPTQTPAQPSTATK